MRCEHINADCARFLGSHGSFNRCTHFVEHHVTLRHVDRTLDALYLRKRSTEKDAPAYMRDDIAYLVWKLYLLVPDVLVACAPEKKNRLEVVSSDSNVPHIRSVSKWLHRVYLGEQRAWSPPGSRAAVAQPWLHYVKQKLTLVY